MILSAGLREILVCPRCKGKLTAAADGRWLSCRSCRLKYPIREGIPVMLVEEAEPANEE